MLPLPLLAGILVGENRAVTPLGSPASDSATAELNPFNRSVDTPICVAPPIFTVTVAAPKARVKLGAGTVRLSACVLVTPPPVAVTVTVPAPEVAAEAALSVSVLLPPPGEAMLVGENAAVTPFGNPVTDRATAELNPLPAAVVKVKVLLLPIARVPLVGFAPRVKVGTITVKPMA